MRGDGTLAAARSSWRALVLGALLVLALILLALFAPLMDWTRALHAALNDLGWQGAVLFVLCFALWNVFLPTMPVQMLAGVIYGLALGTVLIYAGAVIAVTASYYGARAVGRESVERLIGRWPLWGVMDRAVAETGWRAVLLLRLSNVLPANVMNLLLGLSPLPLRTVLWASLLGKLPGILLAVGLGEAGRQLLLDGGLPTLDALSWVLVGVGICATVLLLVLITRAARRQLAIDKQLAESARPEPQS